MLISLPLFMESFRSRNGIIITHSLGCGFFLSLDGSLELLWISLQPPDLTAYRINEING